MHKTIGILGCGWLGLPLSEHLIRNGIKVNGSTTSKEKIPVLLSSGINAYLMDCAPEISGENLEDFFQASALFLNIPFRRNLTDPKYYQDQIASVVSYIEQSPVKHLIFASSTSVYPSAISYAREDEEFNPDTDRSRVLLNIERSLLDNRNFSATILRFSGLYGGTRKIGQFLSGKKELDRPYAPVNLVHLDDCVEIVSRILKQEPCNQIFNICSDKHPTRQELYTKAAQSMRLDAPQFTNDTTTGKVVVNNKIKEYLKYQFMHPDPLEMV